MVPPQTCSIPFSSNHFFTVLTFWGWSYSGLNISNVSRMHHSRNSFLLMPCGKVPLISQIGMKRFTNLPIPILLKKFVAEIIQSTFFSIFFNNFSLLHFLVMGLKIYLACSFV